ncbi:hypothetical protein Tco_0629060 [Tanacetum coccineum]|uniref:Uncharacterized protein n=1 Tax=Tanacetum coccineum TaxID=301880 RepID=A0ABQ4WSC2_9ASTR
MFLSSTSVLSSTSWNEPESMSSGMAFYHVVADYEAEEDARILDSDVTRSIKRRQALYETRTELETRQKEGLENGSNKYTEMNESRFRKAKQIHMQTEKANVDRGDSDRHMQTEQIQTRQIQANISNEEHI